MVFKEIQGEGFEQIIFCNDDRTGLKAIIGMHSTVLGPAVGGCRMWNYADETEALNDVLRLAKGMTYKASMANLNWGGGKSVIIGDPKTAKSPELLQRFGEYVDRLGGNYITAKDVGIGAEDLMEVKKKTQNVLGIQGEAGSSGDPSPATAYGVYHGMKATAKAAFGTDSLKDLKVSLQGLGSVAFYLLGHLHEEGAIVTGCDIDQAVIDRATQKYGIEIVNPDSIYDVDCDIFAPCALGATVNPDTIPRIKAKAIAGAANNQLATEADGETLTQKGVHYAPDYVLNGGGLINIYYERAEGGYSEKRAFAHVEKIGDTIAEIHKRAALENRPTQAVANQLAEERIDHAR